MASAETHVRHGLALQRGRGSALTTDDLPARESEDKTSNTITLSADTGRNALNSHDRRYDTTSTS
jgi:hypothetical protein